MPKRLLKALSLLLVLLLSVGLRVFLFIIKLFLLDDLSLLVESDLVGEDGQAAPLRHTVAARRFLQVSESVRLADLPFFPVPAIAEKCMSF